VETELPTSARYERKLWMRDLVMGVAYPEGHRNP
jgi:hypothetical protein